VPHIGLAPDTETQIAANSERLSAALTRGDGDGAAAVYVENAFVLPPTGDVISGRGAIERFWSGGIEVGLRTVQLDTLERTDAGGVLYEHGLYRMLFVADQSRPRVECGPYVVVHVQDQDGSWRWAVTTFGQAAVLPGPSQGGTT
jgi:ketosteroid isomerase-like protein